MTGDHRQPEAATTRVKVEQYDDTIGNIDQDDDDDDDDQIMMPVAKRHRVHSGYQSIDDPLENSMLSSDNSPSKRYDISLLECLTKSEERAIKKARRKIKNKISAQESRRKKKEYIEGLERRVTVFSSVNQDLKSRLSELEEINREMQEKIILLTSKRRTVQQKPVARPPPVQCCTVATQTESIGQQLRGSEL
eukprot:sb/3471014/